MTMHESNPISKAPLCMTVDPATARHAERDGQTYYFVVKAAARSSWRKSPQRKMRLTAVAAKNPKRVTVTPTTLVLTRMTAAPRSGLRLPPSMSARCVLASPPTHRPTVRNAACRWNAIRHGLRLRQVKPFTPVPCIRKCNRIIPVIAPYAAWRWSRFRRPAILRMKKTPNSAI